LCTFQILYRGSVVLRRYYDDAAIMLRRMVLQAVAPQMYSPITSRKLPWDTSEEGSNSGKSLMGREGPRAHWRTILGARARGRGSGSGSGGSGMRCRRRSRSGLTRSTASGAARSCDALLLSSASEWAPPLPLLPYTLSPCSDPQPVRSSVASLRHWPVGMPRPSPPPIFSCLLPCTLFPVVCRLFPVVCPSAPWPGSGDRTPKQKVKAQVTHPALLKLMLKYNGKQPPRRGQPLGSPVVHSPGRPAVHRTDLAGHWRTTLTGLRCTHTALAAQRRSTRCACLQPRGKGVNHAA